MNIRATLGTERALGRFENWNASQIFVGQLRLIDSTGCNVVNVMAGFHAECHRFNEQWIACVD